MSKDGQGTKHYRKFRPAEPGARTLQTDRRQTDLRRHDVR